MTDSERSKLGGSLRWLSEGYSALRAKIAQAPDDAYDLVIVGSGYGGSMAAAEFAGRVKEDGTTVRICILERGKEYAPGMFPSSLQELPPHVRVHRTGRDEGFGRRDALLDLRLGEHVTAILGNGLGGGSLINAGVMEEPKLEDGDLARARLPPAVVRHLTPAFFSQVRDDLGACDPQSPRHPGRAHGGLRKTEALREVASRSGKPLRYAALTVQTDPGNGDVPQCTLCGDCMTGCNVGAKRSLDTTLLVQARKQEGVDIYTGGTVLTVSREGQDGPWLLETVYTDDTLRKRQGPATLKAHKVILAAGTFGSTEILLRSRARLGLSKRLGHRFSCNGDNLVALHGVRRPVRTTSEECRPLDQRRVGPTITGIVDLGGVLVQEFSVPAPLKRLFDETVTTANLLHKLGEWPKRTRSRRKQGLDSLAVDPLAMNRTLLVGVIGHDESNGEMELPARDPKDDGSPEGRINIKWPGIRTSKVMERDYAVVESLLSYRAGGAAVLPNPAWRLLPKKLEFLLKDQRGPVLTVHPLGGCSMGSSPADGVVDDLGRVFCVPGDGLACADAVHEGLVVLDGSIIPGSLGANPALTIAAIARRAARGLADKWEWHRPQAAAPAARALPRPERPIFRPIRACTPPPPQPTQVELVERLAGPVGEHWVELTLCYQQSSLRNLASKAERGMVVESGQSFLRVYDNRRKDARRQLITLKEHERDRKALYIARVQGRLTLAEPPGGPAVVGHALRAFGAWLVNRGARDLWGRVFYGESPGAPLNPWSLLAFAAHAGEIRRFDYDLAIQETLHVASPLLATWLPPGTPLAGHKELTYRLHSNPWLQLTQLQLTRFPAMKQAAVLTLDGRFLAKQGVPLLRVTQQENQVLALADFASLAACWLRILVNIHLWSFRAPDTAAQRAPHLLPGRMRGVPAAPVRTDLELEDPQRPVKVRLTRYARRGRQPVVLVHGYSASGTTFTHDAIPVPLAQYLWQNDFDVWVLDLRTSAGMPTARDHWRFEDAAYADLPVAIAHIRKETGQPVDVFAHCIGAVMLSMALLREPHTTPVRLLHRPEEPPPKVWERELQALKGNIRRIVLSQKGPLLVYCDDNVLRAYFMRVLRRAILPEGYQFRSPPGAEVASNLLDRVLSTLPYPHEEFARENPVAPWRRARWAGFRHRMDALYARDFSLVNMADATLDAIEDLFGPLNLDTVAQAIHFARQNTITDATGRPFDTSKAALQACWPTGGTLAIHGEDNGLVDSRTLDVMRAQMEHAKVPFEARRIPGYGHQDCLIGVGADEKVFRHVVHHLQQP